MSSHRLVLSLAFIAPLLAQTSFWTTSTVPSSGTTAATTSSDKKSVTLGLRFTSDVPGTVIGVRFHKGTGNGGTHVGALWSNTGAQLATVTFTGETASGWQQANFAAPVRIAANTPYIVSYFAPQGRYTLNTNYPWTSLSAAPLRVAASAGVHAYGATSKFPNKTWAESNYWVDVVFLPDAVKTFWSATQTAPASTDQKAVTLGLKFYSEVAGVVTGVRFYKGTANTGTHIGTLWNGDGTKLATATFTNETASGWQEVRFATPVSITANTTYVVSYFAPMGAYAVTQNFGWSSLNAAPLRVSSTSPGVYTYGSTEQFPTSFWASSNYWVDVVFVPSASVPPPPPPTTYTISGTVTGATPTLTLSGTVGSTVVTDSSGRYSFTGLPSGSYIIAPSQSGYTFSPTTVAVTVSGTSVTGMDFLATPVPAPIPHSVSLTWTGSVSSNVQGYNIYRAAISGGSFTRLNASPVNATSFTDDNVESGRTYYYVATTVDTAGNESVQSTQTEAVVPTP